MTVWLHIDLQGLTFSIVMGYVVCAWIMVIVIFVSDWEALSDQIRDRVVNGDLDVQSCSTEDNGLYGAYDWDELPDEVKLAAELLGYRKFLWDENKEPEEAEKDWSELSPEQQEAATVLGYDADKWNKEDGRNVSSFDEDNEIEIKKTVIYDHLHWDDLPEEVQAAAAKLGFDEGETSETPLNTESSY